MLGLVSPLLLYSNPKKLLRNKSKTSPRLHGSCISSASFIYQHFDLQGFKFWHMKKKKKSRRSTLASSKEAHKQEIVDVYEGQRLDDLLNKIRRSIELAKLAKGELPDNIWIKQQFAIGVNDVSRLLERMPACETRRDAADEISCGFDKVVRRTTLVPLQVVVVAVDCNPKWLTKHVPTLASSRKVPVILVRDGKGSSLALGRLLKLKTVLAIGVKARGSSINAAFQEII